MNDLQATQETQHSIAAGSSLRERECSVFHLRESPLLARLVEGEIQVLAHDVVVGNARWTEQSSTLQLEEGRWSQVLPEFGAAFAAALNLVFCGAARLAQVNVNGLSESQRTFLLFVGLLFEENGAYRCSRIQYVEHARLWGAPASESPFPQQFVTTGGGRHPRRRPKPSGAVYCREIAALDNLQLTLRTACLDDVPDLHRWMNHPRVAKSWGEDGPKAHQRQFLLKTIEDPHTHPLIGCFDGVPFGYFEVYWAREDRIAPFYESHDYDRGIHVLVGEERFQGLNYLRAWFSSLLHFAFMDDARTQRIVAEPRAENRKLIAYMTVKLGFDRMKEFDFPHKRACLLMLQREEFIRKHNI